MTTKQMDKKTYSKPGKARAQMSSKIQLKEKMSGPKKKRGRPRKVVVEETDTKPDIELLGETQNPAYTNSTQSGDLTMNSPECIAATEDVYIVDALQMKSADRSLPKIEHSAMLADSNVFHSPDVTVIEMVPSAFSGSQSVIPGRTYASSVQEPRQHLNIQSNKYGSKYDKSNKLTIKTNRKADKYHNKARHRNKYKKRVNAPEVATDNRLKCDLCGEMFSSKEHHNYHFHKHFESYEEYAAYISRNPGHATVTNSSTIETETIECYDTDYNTDNDTDNDTDNVTDSNNSMIEDTSLNETDTSGGVVGSSSLIESTTESSISEGEEVPVNKTRTCKKDLKVCLHPISTKLIQKYNIPKEYSPKNTGSITSTKTMHDTLVPQAKSTVDEESKCDETLNDKSEICRNSKVSKHKTTKESLVLSPSRTVQQQKRGLGKKCSKSGKRDSNLNRVEDMSKSNTTEEYSSVEANTTEIDEPVDDLPASREFKNNLTSKCVYGVGHGQKGAKNPTVSDISLKKCTKTYVISKPRSVQPKPVQDKSDDIAVSRVNETNMITHSTKLSRHLTSGNVDEENDVPLHGKLIPSNINQRDRKQTKNLKGFDVSQNKCEKNVISKPKCAHSKSMQDKGVDLEGGLKEAVCFTNSTILSQDVTSDKADKDCVMSSSMPGKDMTEVVVAKGDYRIRIKYREKSIAGRTKKVDSTKKMNDAKLNADQNLLESEHVTEDCFNSETSTNTKKVKSVGDFNSSRTNKTIDISSSDQEKLEVQVLRCEQNDVIMKPSRLPSNSSVSPEKIRILKQQRLLKQQIAFKRMSKIPPKMNFEMGTVESDKSLSKTDVICGDMTDFCAKSGFDKDGSALNPGPSSYCVKAKSNKASRTRSQRDKPMKPTHASLQKHKPHSVESDNTQLMERTVCNQSPEGNISYKVLREMLNAKPNKTDCDTLSKTEVSTMFVENSGPVENCEMNSSSSGIDHLSPLNTLSSEGSQSDLITDQSVVYIQADHGANMYTTNENTNTAINSEIENVSSNDITNAMLNTEIGNLTDSKIQMVDFEQIRNVGFTLSDDSCDDEDMDFLDVSEGEGGDGNMDECIGFLKANIAATLVNPEIVRPCYSPVKNDCNLNQTVLLKPNLILKEGGNAFGSEVGSSPNDVTLSPIKLSPLRSYDETDSGKDQTSLLTDVGNDFLSPNKSGELEIYQLPPSGSYLNISDIQCFDTDKAMRQLNTNQSETGQYSEQTDLNINDSGKYPSKIKVNQSVTKQNFYITDVEEYETGQNSCQTDVKQCKAGQHSIVKDVKQSEHDKYSVISDQGNSVFTLPVEYPVAQLFKEKLEAEGSPKRTSDNSTDMESPEKKYVLHQCKTCHKRFRSNVKLKLHISLEGHTWSSASSIKGSSDSEVDRSLHQVMGDSDSVTGSVIGSATSSVTGSTTGSVTGSVTCSATGSVTGTVTGSATGSVTGSHRHQVTVGSDVVSNNNKHQSKKGSDMNVGADYKPNVTDKCLNAVSPMHKHEAPVNKKEKYKEIKKLLSKKGITHCLSPKVSHGAENEELLNSSKSETAVMSEKVTANTDSWLAKDKEIAQAAIKQSNKTNLSDNCKQNKDLRKKEESKKRKRSGGNNDNSSAEKVTKKEMHSECMTCPLCKEEVTQKSFFQHKLNHNQTVPLHDHSFDSTSSKLSLKSDTVDEYDTSSDISQCSRSNLKVVLKKVKMSNSIINGTSLKFCGSLENPLWKIKDTKRHKRDAKLKLKFEKSEQCDVENVNESNHVSVGSKVGTVDDAVESDRKGEETSVIDQTLQGNCEGKEMNNSVIEGVQHHSERTKKDTSVIDKSLQGISERTGKNTLVIDKNLQGNSEKKEKAISVNDKKIQGNSESMSKGVKMVHGDIYKKTEKKSTKRKETQKSKISQGAIITDFEKQLLDVDKSKELSKEKPRKRHKSSHKSTETHHEEDSKVNTKLKHRKMEPVTEQQKHFKNSKMAQKIYKRDKEKTSIHHDDGLPDFSKSSVKLDSLPQLVVGKSLNEINNNTRLSSKTQEDNSQSSSKPLHKELKESIESLGIVPKIKPKDKMGNLHVIQTENLFQTRSYGSIDSTTSLHSYKIPKFDFTSSKLSAFGSITGFSLSDNQSSSGSVNNPESLIGFSSESCEISSLSCDDNNSITLTDQPLNTHGGIGNSTPTSEVNWHGGFDFTKQQGSSSFNTHGGPWVSFVETQKLEKSRREDAYRPECEPRKNSVVTSTPHFQHAQSGEKAVEELEISQLSSIHEKTDVPRKRRRLNRYKIEDDDSHIVGKKTRGCSDSSVAGSPQKFSNQLKEKETEEHTRDGNKPQVEHDKVEDAAIVSQSGKETADKQKDLNDKFEVNLEDIHIQEVVHKKVQLDEEHDVGLDEVQLEDNKNDNLDKLETELSGTVDDVHLNADDNVNVDNFDVEDNQLDNESDQNSTNVDQIEDDFDVDIEDIQLDDIEEPAEKTLRNPEEVEDNTEEKEVVHNENSDSESEQSDIESKKSDSEGEKSDSESKKNDSGSEKSDSERENSEKEDFEKSDSESENENSVLDGEPDMTHCETADEQETDEHAEDKKPIKKAVPVELTEITDDVLYLSDPDMDMFSGEEIDDDIRDCTKEPSPDMKGDCKTVAEVEKQEVVVKPIPDQDGTDQKESQLKVQPTKWESSRRLMWLPRGYCFNHFNKRCSNKRCTYNHNPPNQMELLQSFKEHLERGDCEVCLDILRSHRNLHDKIGKHQLEILYRHVCDNADCFWLLKMMNDKGMLQQITVDNYIRTFAFLQYSDYLFGVFEMARSINMQLQPDVMVLLLKIFSSHETLLDKLIAVMTYTTEDENFSLPAECVTIAIKGVLKVPGLLNQLTPLLSNMKHGPLGNLDMIDSLCDEIEKSDGQTEIITRLRELCKHTGPLCSPTADSPVNDTGFDDTWSTNEESYWMDNVKSVKFTKNFAYLGSLYHEKRNRMLPFSPEECGLYIDVIGVDRSCVDGAFNQFLENVKSKQSLSKESPLPFKKQFVYIAGKLFESCFVENQLPACIEILATMKMYELSPSLNDKFVLNAVKVCLRVGQYKLAVDLLKGVKLDQMHGMMQAELIRLLNPLVELLFRQNLTVECLCVVLWAFQLVYNGKPNVIERERLIRLPYICYSLISAFLNQKHLNLAVDVYRLLEQYGQSFPFHEETEVKMMACLLESEHKDIAERIYEKLKKLNVYKSQVFSTPRKITIPCRAYPNIKPEILLIVNDYLLCLYNMLCDQVIDNKKLEPRDLHLKVVILRSVNQKSLLQETKAVLETSLNPPLHSTMDCGCLVIEPESLQNYLNYLDAKGRCQGLTFNRRPGPRSYQLKNMQRK